MRTRVDDDLGPPMPKKASLLETTSPTEVARVCSHPSEAKLVRL